MIHINGRTFITAGEAPEYLGADVTPEMVRQWGRRRKANKYGVGKEVYYDVTELIEVEYVTRTARHGRPRARSA